MKYDNETEFNELKKKVSEKEIKSTIYFDSNECKVLLADGKTLAQKMPLPKIVYCFMCLNRSNEMKIAIEHVERYVDKIIAVDGGSVDGTLEYLNNHDKIDVVNRKWDDQFDVQRNQYVKRVLERYKDYWMLCSDTDEWFCDDLMKNLKYIILAAERCGISRLGFLSWFKIVKSDDSPKEYDKPVRINSEGIEKTSFKKLCFKPQDGMEYIKSPHEALLGRWKIACLGNTEWYFEHVKTRKSEAERGCRNYFISGPKMTKNEAWHQFRRMTDYYGWKIWSDMNKDLISGVVSDDILRWIWDHKDWDKDGPPSSEQREYWELYYDYYHPDDIEKDKRGLKL